MRKNKEIPNVGRREEERGGGHETFTEEIFWKHYVFKALRMCIFFT